MEGRCSIVGDARWKAEQQRACGSRAEAERGNATECTQNKKQTALAYGADESTGRWK